MYYHASPLKDLHILSPHTSNHGSPLLYLSAKRENTLPYLSNAIELYGNVPGNSLKAPITSGPATDLPGRVSCALKNTIPTQQKKPTKAYPAIFIP